MRGDAHVRFGGRAWETGRGKPRNRAPVRPNTHFPRAGMAVLIVQDLVSRKWITEVVSVEETSTQVEIGFTDALEAEGLLEAVERARRRTRRPRRRRREPARSCSRCPTTARR